MAEIKTRAELVSGALKSLFVVGAGQEPDAEDYDEADSKVNSLLSQLRADNICDIPEPNEIPAELFDALTELLANNCGPIFGIPWSADKKIGFEQLIRRTVASRPSYETLKVDYF